MKALIDPRSNRICEVREESFEVAKPLFWIDCPLGCEADSWYYDGGKCVPLPPSPEADPAQPE